MNEYISKQSVIDYLMGYLNSIGERGADNLFDRGQRRALINSIQDISVIKGADVQPVKQDTELSIILQDYGIKDTDTLRYILDQYQKIIVDITGGQMSYLTYPAKTVIACADDNYRKCYEESMEHGRWELISQNKFTGTKTLRCSYCKNYFVVRDDTLNAGRGDANFCPNCGCKQDMDGDSE